MPAIYNARLSVTPDHARRCATVVVTCDISFTEFEVNAMRKLGLRYRLDCELVNRDVAYDRSAITFSYQEYPRPAADASANERAVFESVAPFHDLHMFLFGDDVLVAQLRLTNLEDGTEVEGRTEAVLVNLAA
jgi:hypothetical protein